MAIAPWDKPDDYNEESYLKFKKVKEEPLKKLAKAIFDQYKPRSVIDLGCGDAVLLSFLRKWGVSVLGVDWSPSAVKLAGVPFLLWDLRVPLDYHHFDVAVCLDVAEHLSIEHADTLVQNISRAPCLVFAAAPPRASGLHHVNCQPMEYWEEKLSLYRLVPDREAQAHIDSAMRNCGIGQYERIRCFWRSG